MGHVLKIHLFIFGGFIFVLPLHLYAQGLSTILLSHQQTLPKLSVPTNPSTQTPTRSTTQTAEVNTCDDHTQKSFSLNDLNSLVLASNGEFTFAYDQEKNTLTVKSNTTTYGNCDEMLEPVLETIVQDDKISYEFKMVFKIPVNCQNSKCSYKFQKKEDSDFKTESRNFAPNIDGFYECLKESGVINDGSINQDKIFKNVKKYEFPNINQSGDVYFVSEGPAAATQENVSSDGCIFREKKVALIMTKEDEEKNKIKDELDSLTVNDCENCTKEKLITMLENPLVQDFAPMIRDLLKEIIDEEVQNSAKKILSGKHEKDDLEVIPLFIEHIVNPKIESAKQSYENWAKETNPEKKSEKKKDLDSILAEIEKLNKSPYFLKSHVSKLVEKNDFSTARDLNEARLQLTHFRNLGKKQQNQIVTPSLAASRVSSEQENFNEYLLKEEERYEYRTGQVTGKADEYADMANAYLKRVKIRTENYMDELLFEQERMTPPNGHCFKYWVNTQYCTQDSAQRMSELQSQLKSLNEADLQKAKEFEDLSNEYAALEKEGREYLANQNGEDTEEESVRILVDWEGCYPEPRREDPVENSGRLTQQNPSPVYQQQSMQQMMGPWSFSYPGPSNPSFMNMGMTQYPPNSPYMNYYGAPQYGNRSAGLYSPIFPQQQNWLQGYPQQGWPAANFSGQFSFY